VTDDEWNAEFKSAFALRNRDPKSAVARLRRLSRRAIKAERNGVGAWHAAQSLGMAASILSGVGQHREAAAVFRQVAKLHQGSFRHHGYGLGSALASAALELFKAGQERQAVPLAWESLRMFGQFPDPSSVHEEIIRSLRAHLNRVAPRGRSKSTG
jgi:hypothetical protein